MHRRPTLGEVFGGSAGALDTQVIVQFSRPIGYAIKAYPLADANRSAAVALRRGPGLMQSPAAAPSLTP